MLRLLAAGAALAAWIAAAACVAPPVDSPRTKVTQDTPVRVPENAQNKVDILFMIDNSNSMDAMQAELKLRFHEFFQIFQDLAARGTYSDLHVGVVTSDYGAGLTDGQSGSGCFASPGGQKGFLQTLPSANAVDPPPNCRPPMGAPFIEYAFDPAGGAPTSNLPAGQDLVGTFTCMASVGALGCGFEHQLESVYQALINQKENKGFLRSDALLAVVFVTNEDDGSAPRDATFYDPNADGNVFGDYDTYRQTRFAIQCGGAPIPYLDGAGNGAPQLLADCAGEPNPMQDRTRAFDVARYATFFGQPHVRGGVKTSPRDVILFGIDGPAAPLETILAVKGSGLGKPFPTTNPLPGSEAYLPCGPRLVPGSCVMRLQHSCQNRVSKAFFADPPVRLHAVIESAVNHQETSICGERSDAAPDFTTALQTLGNLISTHIGPGCIPARLPVVAQPSCVVRDVTENPDGSESEHIIPKCDGAGLKPCWKVEAKPQCAQLSPDGVGLTIERDGPAPADTSAQVECETVPAN